MNRLLEWAKHNILILILLGIVGYLVFTRPTPISPFLGGVAMNRGMSEVAQYDMAAGNDGSFGISAPAMGKVMMPQPYNEAAPVTGVDRLVVRDTSLSLQVKNVNKAIEEIESIAVTTGGYMVNSNLSQPEGAASGYISVRVPSEKRADVLSQYRGLAVKTVNENVQGTDVTDQYTDLEERLRILGQTKAKIEDILAKATEVSDLLSIQQQLTSIQSQIDSVKGQQKYLEQTAKLTLVSVYLSTDEFALPFTPDQPWRPEVIFKQAVRSLVTQFRNVGTLFIWAIVYTPIWAPLLLLAWFFKKKLK